MCTTFVIVKAYQNSINSRLDDIVDTLYQKINKELDTIIIHTHVTYNTEKNTHSFHSWLVNLTNTKFTKGQINTLTLRLLMSYIYIYMELLVKPEMLTSYIYIWTYVWQRWNSLFLFAAQCFNTESMQRGFLCHICV